MSDYQYSAFSGYGIEIEYMIVDKQRLDVLPIADRLLDGAEDMDVARGDAAWSNELALHVIETKTAGPAPDLRQAARAFRREVDAINALLGEHGGRLMPTGMHPWMDPFSETKLWPHQNNEIYSAFDRIFGCQGHGWSNLQSMHINLPFKNEEQFSKLHAACRLALPLLPAVASSTPFWDGVRAPNLDQRLAVYRDNCKKVPLVTGRVVPEPVFSYAAYAELLQELYEAIAPLDPDGILQEEWLNARGAIARFDRGAIEIRVLDTQECPEQDLAIAFFVTELVKSIYDGHFIDYSSQTRLSTTMLYEQYERAVKSARRAECLPDYARCFQLEVANLGQMFDELLDRLVPRSSNFRPALDLIAKEGTLAERLAGAVGPKLGRDRLFDVYLELCACLSDGHAYV